MERSKWNKIVDVLGKLERGAEVGGPTPLFMDGEPFPLYSYIKNLDAMNMFEDNIWQKDFGDYYIPQDTVMGEQFNLDICDEKILSAHPKRYDFVVMSHVIEHIANPILAIFLMKKYILKSNSYFLFIIPDKKEMFDRKRKTTTVEHLIEDYVLGVDEHDKTHTKESLDLMDYSRRNLVFAKDINRRYDIDNYKARIIHHHTFSGQLVSEFCEYCGLTIVSQFQEGMHIVVLGRGNEINSTQG